MNNEGISFILNYSWDIFFDETNDEDENVKIPRVCRYAKEIVPRFSDRTFKTHFRITPDTFEALLTKLHSIEDDNVNVGCKPIPLEKQLMITIWYLSNMESFRSVADRFDVSKSTCWDILYRTCKSLLKVNTIYKIIWPNRERAATIMRKFQQINGFPNK